MYIGSAYDLSKRISEYFSIKYLDSNKNMYICNALILHGYSSYSLTILEYIDITDLSKIDAKQKILEREQYFLDLLLPEYNILKLAGSLLGYKHTEETIALMSLAKSGENNPRGMLGKSHSPETLALMSKVQSSIDRIGSNHPMYGKNHSTETLLKMSEAIGSKIQVINKETNETIIYFSNCKAAEALCCSEKTIRRYIKNKKLYKGKYLFLKYSVQ
jgi:group I intron endonuclease